MISNLSEYSGAMILRLEQVKRKTGLSRSSIYAFVGAGTFPVPVSLGTRSVGWIESEVEQWIAERIRSRSHASALPPVQAGRI